MAFDDVDDRKINRARVVCWNVEDSLENFYERTVFVHLPGTGIRT